MDEKIVNWLKELVPQNATWVICLFDLSEGEINMNAPKVIVHGFADRDAAVILAKEIFAVTKLHWSVVPATGFNQMIADLDLDTGLRTLAQERRNG